jgi:hypothetical protein
MEEFRSRFFLFLQSRLLESTTCPITSYSSRVGFLESWTHCMVSQSDLIAPEWNTWTCCMVSQLDLIPPEWNTWTYCMVAQLDLIPPEWNTWTYCMVSQLDLIPPEWNTWTYCMVAQLDLIPQELNTWTYCMVAQLDLIPPGWIAEPIGSPGGSYLFSALLVLSTSERNFWIHWLHISILILLSLIPETSGCSVG